MTARVTAVILTYSARYDYCAVATRAALVAGSDQVLIVDNGSGEANRRALDDLESDDVRVLRLPRNIGSAGGYAAGIAAAARTDTEFVWLLDDDNAPDADALQELLTAWPEEAKRRRPLVLASYRPSRSYQRALLTKAPSQVFPSPGAFLYFSLIDRTTSRLRRPVQGRLAGCPEMPYCPYGGSFFAASQINSMGLPNKDLVLYEDDAEYFARAVASGGAILLVPKSIVRDLQSNWLDSRLSGPRALLETGSPLRLYYSVRNRVYFEQELRKGHPLHRWLNRSIYMVALRMMAQSAEAKANLKLLRIAVHDGTRRRLGESHEWPLE